MKIIQQAFAGPEKMLKGGLHCHTTRSDGSGTPEEVIRLHCENGYDFLAITDHRNYNYRNFAPDLPITILPGMEYDSCFEGSYASGTFRCFHTVCIGPAREDGNGYEQDETMPCGECTCQEEYQPYLDEIHAKGNLTIYCHPEWSGTPARYFEKLEGDFAMEIWNSGCVIDCDQDSDAAYWDELLGQGKKLWGVATDDGHAMNNHCNGWVMVRAENNINAILDALRDGAFYSSCGPEIYDFYVEDGVAHIKCSPVAEIRIHADRHPTRIHHDKAGELTGGAYNIQNYEYVRISVVDREGRKAWTNPIWLKD
ncbi:MAG: PHP domain-containing protein [Clostridia bacterium]|nr:PHP domain-containing protein [Clostridia bacterium]